MKVAFNLYNPLAPVYTAKNKDRGQFTNRYTQDERDVTDVGYRFIACVNLIYMSNGEH